MAGIVRSTAVIFSTTGLTGTGGFGAAAGGTITTEAGSSNSVSNIQTGTASAWAGGWLAAVLGASKFPAIEDMNAVDNVFSTQIAYILTRGIPEYDAGTTYNTGDVARGVGLTTLYSSIGDGNVGYALSNATYWKFLGDLANLGGGSGTLITLTGNTAYYVATTGNDSNPGTSGSPWLTIQHAFNYIKQNINTAGYQVTINVADGTYTGTIVLNGPFTGGGTVILSGDTGTPASCIISTTGDCLAVNFGAQLQIQGFKMTSSGGNCINVGPDASVEIVGVMNFGAAAANHLYANFGGQIISTANYTISNAAESHVLAIYGSTIQIQNITITISGTPDFSNQFATAKGNSTIIIYTDTFSGSATGTRYSAILNGVIDTNGGGSTYLPGNAGGSTATGGQYA